MRTSCRASFSQNIQHIMQPRCFKVLNNTRTNRDGDYLDMSAPLLERFDGSSAWLIDTFFRSRFLRTAGIYPVECKKGRSNSTEIPSIDLPGAIAAVPRIRPIIVDYIKGYTELRWVSEFPT